METTEPPAPTPRRRQPNRPYHENKPTIPPPSVDSAVPGANDVTAELAAVRDRIAEAIGGPSETDQYGSHERMAAARSFFESMGIPIGEDGLISQNLSPEQIDALTRWRKEAMGGFIEMPDEDTLYRKTLLAVSLWRQSEESNTNYLLGKGIGAEVSIRGRVKERVKRLDHFSYRSHSDFELYAVEYEHDEQGGNTSGKSVYPESFKAVFGGQEYFPPTKTKGLRALPPELLRQTAEAVDLGGVEVLVPELELQFLDKWESPGSYDRPEGTDAEVLARQYDLDRDKVHDYLDRFVIQPAITATQESPRNNPQWHLDRVARQIAFTREQLIEGGIAEPSMEQVLARLNRDMQRQIEIHTVGDVTIGGVRLSLWKDLTPDQIGEGDRIIDAELVRTIEEQIQQHQLEATSDLRNKHREIDDFFLEVDVDHALEERKLPQSIDRLPPVPEGYVRWVHTTNPTYVIPILGKGLDYEKYGMIDSTARPVTPDDPDTYFGTDPRFNYPTVRTIIFDIPMPELRLHRDVTRAPGILPSQYIVGVIDGYRPLEN